MGGALMAASALIPTSLRAQVSYGGEVSQSVSAIHVSLSNEESGQSVSGPGLRNQSDFKLNAALDASRVRISSEARLGVEYEAGQVQDALFGSVLEGDGASSPSAGTGLHLGNRIAPKFVIGAEMKPAAWLKLLLSERFDASRYFNHDVDALYASNDPVPTVDLSGEAANSSQPGYDAASLMQGTWTVPQDSWSNEVTAGGELAYGLRTTPAVSAQYQVFRQFECVEADFVARVGATLLARNFESDSATFRASSLTLLDDGRYLGTGFRFTREDNRPLEDCAWVVGVAHVFYQVNPTLSYVRRGAPWSLGLEAGGVSVWGRSRQPDDSLGPVGGLDFRPVGRLMVGRTFPKGEARISGGTEVATLLGQPAPTYNLIAAAQGSLFPSPAWTLRGSATALQALLINSYYLQSGLYCTAVTALATGQAQLEWRPVPWFRGQAGYSVSLNSTRDQAGCEAYIPVSTDGNEAPYQRYDQVIYHTVTLTASFSLEGGLSSRPSRQVSRP